MADRQPEPTEIPEEEAITLTQLPTLNAAPPQEAPPQAPPPAPPAEIPPPRPAAATPVPATPAPRAAAPPPVAATPAPTPTAQPTVAPAPAPTPATEDPFLVDFPRYPGTESGSFGLPAAYDPFSQRTEDAIAQVSSFFERELQAKEFSAQLLEDEPNRKVYQVSKAGTTQYLTLFPNPEGAGTSIVLSPEPLPTDLAASSVVSPEEASFYADLPVPTVSGNDDNYQRLSEPEFLLSQPSAFYEDLGDTGGGSYIEPQLRSAIQRAVLAARQPDPQALFAEIQNRLEIAYFEVESAGSYGGGDLYQINRDGITAYLSLVPTQTGTGTAIFVWNRAPQ